MGRETPREHETSAWAVGVASQDRLLYWGQLTATARGQRGWSQEVTVTKVNAMDLPNKGKLSRQSLGDFERGSPDGTCLRLITLTALWEVLEIDLAGLMLNPHSDAGKLLLYVLGRPALYTRRLYHFLTMEGAEHEVLRERRCPPAARRP